MEVNLVSAVLPVDPAALAAALPDIPCWVYARSQLKSGASQVRLAADRDAALILDATSAALVGRPDPLLLREELAGDPPGPALLVQDDAVLAVRTVLLSELSVRSFGNPSPDGDRMTEWTLSLNAMLSSS